MKTEFRGKQPGPPPDPSAAKACASGPPGPDRGADRSSCSTAGSRSRPSTSVQSSRSAAAASRPRARAADQVGIERQGLRFRSHATSSRAHRCCVRAAHRAPALRRLRARKGGRQQPCLQACRPRRPRKVMGFHDGSLASQRPQPPGQLPAGHRSAPPAAPPSHRGVRSGAPLCGGSSANPGSAPIGNRPGRFFHRLQPSRRSLRALAPHHGD